jgi:predicted dehydrogenase
MQELRFGLFGAGFWADFHLAGWGEVPGARCVAIFNRTRTKAQRLADKFQIDHVYDDPREMLVAERLDFVDCITDVDTHRQFVLLAAEHRLPVICQKPLAPTLSVARDMAATCQRAGVPLLVHENWRWQTPLRALKRVLEEGAIGRVFRARIQYANSFPVFDNQPFLKELEQFVLTDMGTHILDAARFLFGEARSVYCRTHQVHEDIRGEDVASVVLGMDSGATVSCEISYATRMEHEQFPQTFVFAEGAHGSVELGHDYWIRTTTAAGTLAKRCPPPRYGWADPQYDVVHASIVPCHMNLLAALQGRASAETAAEDNLKTLALVSAAYESARTEHVVESNA